MDQPVKYTEYHSTRETLCCLLNSLEVENILQLDSLYNRDRTESKIATLYSTDYFVHFIDGILFQK